MYNPFGAILAESPSPYCMFNVHEFEVKFEYVWPEGSHGVNEFNTLQNVYPGSSIRRNIDKYYEIYKPIASQTPEFGATPEVDNQVTQIRVKRINSEFALVDYNITVKVNNPPVTTTIPGDPSAYIDFCSPRFTQYLRFVYIPDDAGSAGESKLVYGNDLSLINWSTYKNWFPGTAIVGDDYQEPILNQTSTNSPGAVNGKATTYLNIGENIRTMTNDWSPFYNDQPTFSGDGAYTSPMTWNGNVLEATAYYAYNFVVEEAIGKGNTRYSTATFPLRSFYNANGFTANGSSEYYSRNTAYAAFGSDLRILSNAYSLFPYSYSTDGVANAKLGLNANVQVPKQLAFIGFLGSMYALWKNESFLRNKNTQWRILPAQPHLLNDGTDDDTGNPNRSFYLEVQLSTPIMHCDTPLGGKFYGQDSTGYVTPYRYLTLNGQAIVKFAETSMLERPTTIDQDQVSSNFNIDDGLPPPPNPEDWPGGGLPPDWDNGEGGLPPSPGTTGDSWVDPNEYNPAWGEDQPV